MLEQIGQFADIRPVTMTAIIIRLLVSCILGGLIGAERGIKHRPAGLRTHMLVSLGACIVMITNQYTIQVFGMGDPVRLGAQVVSGIGFLGAGTIIVTQRNQIKGLTTAAGLWVSACIGLATGIGLCEVSVLSSIFMFAILTAIHFVDDRLRSKISILPVYVELKKEVRIGEFLDFVKKCGFSFSNLELHQDNLGKNVKMNFTVTIGGLGSFTEREALSILKQMEGLEFIVQINE